MHDNKYLKLNYFFHLFSINCGLYLVAEKELREHGVGRLDLHLPARVEPVQLQLAGHHFRGHVQVGGSS